jgi:hypothetical protein
MALAFEELREERTGGPCTQDEDSHGFSKLYHSREGERGVERREEGRIASFCEGA